MKTKTIMIVQSIPDWIKILVKTMADKLPNLVDCIIATDSFDHALDLVPKKGELIVVTSEMFHDHLSIHKESVKQKIPNSEKNGDKLAELIKKINKRAKVYVFSEFNPKSKENYDGFIQKVDYSEERSVENFMKIFE